MANLDVELHITVKSRESIELARESMVKLGKSYELLVDAMRQCLKDFDDATTKIQDLKVEFECKC